MRARYVFALLLTLIASAVLPFCAARADTLNGTGGDWQAWTQAQLFQGAAPTPGTPYWNNLSGDGPQGNIGWCITGGGASCTMAGSPGTVLPYYGTASGGAVANIFFTSSGDPLKLTLAAIVTNEDIGGQYDVFGYYVVPASGLPVLVPLFSTQPGVSDDKVGDVATLHLAAGTNYGFYVANIQGGGGSSETDDFFDMNAGLDDATFDNGSPLPSPDNYQHFAIFQNGSGYIVGEVDAYACPTGIQPGTTPCIMQSQFDYNDMIVTVSPDVTNPTPEPATIGLIGIGLASSFVLLRRKLRRED